jgi:hypothetical protein
MRTAHALVLSLSALLAGWAGYARAQVKFADLSPAQKNNLRNGSLVSLELDNGTKVKGRVVRIDMPTDRIFLRIHAGEAPVPYAGNDIRKIEPATGVPAQPEIHQQVIYNGAERSVVYTSSVLSPAERDVLARLQKAQDNMQAVVHSRERHESALAMETTFQEERLRTQRLINLTLMNENSASCPYLPCYKSLIIAWPQMIPAAAPMVDRAPPPDPQALSKAREDLARLQDMAVYDSGRLVAVIVK